MTTTVLQRDCVSVVVIHLGDQINGVRVERQARVVDDAECVKLMTESCFGYDELSCIRSTVYTSLSAAFTRARLPGSLEAICELVTDQRRYVALDADRLTNTVCTHDTRLQQRSCTMWRAPG